MEQFHIFPLGYHRNLGKLVPVHTYNLPDLFIYLAEPSGIFAAIRQDQTGFCLHHSDRALSIPVFPFARPLVGRIPPDAVDLSFISKDKFHPGLIPVLCILAAHHCAVAAVTAGLAIESKRNRVKYCRLSRSRISGN